ncbi:MAG: glycerol dehydrogenase [Propionivibrio sp.]|nr:glycerol dehydrogenase [Propionivibrio sp.]MBP7525600.1 glycerol dehydrogenase [Propionivibrio sp.]MBP8162824.1 glycerol dehydrogenase [Propionivibrio sp.]
MIKGVRFPGRYLQGPGCITRLGREILGFGPRALVVLDGGVFERLRDTVAAAAGETDINLLRHGGECSEAEINRIRKEALAFGADVIVGIGGGKALDTTKAVADEVGKPVIVIPTIAASDAPCSALAVIYYEDGTVAYDRFLPRNPDLVLVDTEIIAKAPVRFLSAGIGDALATYYEAESCRRSGAHNCLGMPGCGTAYVLARACRDTIFEHGAAAIEECNRQYPGPAIEAVVEANILLSGIGFESGGVAAAHAVHHGLCELDEVHHFLHGEKVAIGVLAGLKLQGDAEEFERVRAFCRAVRLPTRLRDIGIEDASDEKLRRVAGRACRPDEIIHHEPMPVSVEQLTDALRQLQ